MIAIEDVPVIQYHQYVYKNFEAMLPFGNIISQKQHSLKRAHTVHTDIERQDGAILASWKSIIALTSEVIDQSAWNFPANAYQ